MPPPSLESTSPCPKMRGKLYFICASSTCSLPAAVRALCAKMSRISAVRSRIFTPSAISRFLCCDGVSSSSKMTSVARSFWMNIAISSTLPRPKKSAVSGFAFFWMNVPTTVAPAVRASSASSASESSVVHTAQVMGASIPASTARSSSSSVACVRSLERRLLMLWMSGVRRMRFR